MKKVAVALALLASLTLGVGEAAHAVENRGPDTKPTGPPTTCGIRGWLRLTKVGNTGYWTTGGLVWCMGEPISGGTAYLTMEEYDRFPNRVSTRPVKTRTEDYFRPVMAPDHLWPLPQSQNALKFTPNRWPTVHFDYDLWLPSGAWKGRSGRAFTPLQVKNIKNLPNNFTITWDEKGNTRVLPKR